MIQSPFNYTGGKYKLLPQILPCFPKEINTFVDLFCGGCNVGLNAEAPAVVYNDRNAQLIGLCRAFKNADKEAVFQWIYEIIDQYQLSLASKNGYEFYGCESSEGLGNYNRNPYLKLREDFNAGRLEGRRYAALYVLIVYAFNNQIRFNSRGEFNLPVGKRDFNERMAAKLSAFMDRIQTQNCRFTCLDFREFEVKELDRDDFVYVDPPYLITSAAYNAQGGWNEDRERELLAFLDSLSEKRIRFALSNVLRSKGKENHILMEWLGKNKNRYRTIPLHYSYSNSNYQTKDKSSASEEVLVVDY